MTKKTKIGIIGCGNISQVYFNAAKKFDIIEVAACADINMEVANAKAKEHNLKALTVEEIIADKDIDIILNLTIPKVHAEINLKALAANKHVYTEKPFALDLEEAKQVIDLAQKKGLFVGCAPDTFLGGGLQTCRKLIDDGWLGDVIGGTAFMMSRGPENGHPNPAFFYQKGGGPMLDMGPYYITALVHLLGPVKSVTGKTAISFNERIATSENCYGEILPVEIPTHQTGILEFHSGALITVTISFDVLAHKHISPIEIYGSTGSMIVPDPNTFGGPVKIFRKGSSSEWSEMALSHGYTDNVRSIGLVDMVFAINSGREHRCNAELAIHVLEIMQAFEKSSESGKCEFIKSFCKQPTPLSLGILEGKLD